VPLVQNSALHESETLFFFFVFFFFLFFFSCNTDPHLEGGVYKQLFCLSSSIIKLSLIDFLLGRGELFIDAFRILIQTV
jgi:hypothetical protein